MVEPQQNVSNTEKKSNLKKILIIIFAICLIIFISIVSTMFSCKKNNCKNYIIQTNGKRIDFKREILDIERDDNEDDTILKFHLYGISKTTDILAVQIKEIHFIIEEKQYLSVPNFFLWNQFGKQMKNLETIELIINKPYSDSTDATEYFCKDMFKGCTKLKTVNLFINKPVIDEDKTYKKFCESMFEGCTNLQYVNFYNDNYISNAKFAEGTYEECYKSMFKGCTSLVTLYSSYLKTAVMIGEHTAIPHFCESMFEGCTKLKKLPKYLKLVDLKDSLTDCDSYASCMFKDCSSLESIPKEFSFNPYTHPINIAVNCYTEMFSGCTSLKFSSEQNDGLGFPTNTEQNEYCVECFKGDEDIINNCPSIVNSDGTIIDFTKSIGIKRAE